MAGAPRGAGGLCVANRCRPLRSSSSPVAAHACAACAASRRCGAQRGPPRRSRGGRPRWRARGPHSGTDATPRRCLGSAWWRRAVALAEAVHLSAIQMRRAVGKMAMTTSGEARAGPTRVERPARSREDMAPVLAVVEGMAQAAMALRSGHPCGEVVAARVLVAWGWVAGAGLAEEVEVREAAGAKALERAVEEGMVTEAAEMLDATHLWTRAPPHRVQKCRARQIAAIGLTCGSDGLRRLQRKCRSHSFARVRQCCLPPL